MISSSTPKSHALPPAADILARLTETLKRYSDKEWNYSRITLISKALHECDFPYVLWCDLVAVNSKDGEAELRRVRQEIEWGERHSSELGILEIISLRLNKALIDLSTDQVWSKFRPVMRVESAEALRQQGVSEAFWYEVVEVAGEEFDTR